MAEEEKEEEPETGGQPKEPTAEGANQVLRPATPVELQGVSIWMKLWMMLLMWMLTGSQCNHPSPIQEADLVDLRTSTEVEQMEVCHKIAMRKV